MRIGGFGYKGPGDKESDSFKTRNMLSVSETVQEVQPSMNVQRGRGGELELARGRVLKSNPDSHRLQRKVSKMAEPIF